jgi:hypothetical protein
LTRRECLGALAPLVLPWPAAVGRRQRKTAAPAPAPAGRIRTLRSVSALPPEITAVYREPTAFEQSSSGQYFVFDRLAHTVYGVDARMQGGWKIVQIGGEAGRIIEPTAFSLAGNGTFAVADRPAARQRVQFFAAGGSLLGGFTLPARASESVVVDSMVLNGVGSLQYDGRTVYVSDPETGWLIAQYSPTGGVIRTFGTLRATGHESDRDLHCALNTGLPLLNPRGGFYFVFETGVPLFRKYGADGSLVFERHIEGPELDPILGALPTRWPQRRAGDRQLPLVSPTIRTARADAAGRLWVCLAGIPVAYVYGPDGEKVGAVQFRAAGTIAPTSLFFSPSGRLLVTPGCYEFDPPFGPSEAARER